MDQLTFNRVPLQESPPVLGKPIEVGPGVGDHSPEGRPGSALDYVGLLIFAPDRL